MSSYPALLGTAVLLLTAVPAHAASDPASVVPAHAPRTMILHGQHDAFREYCLHGEGADTWARIKRDLDERFMGEPFPAEPVTYGDPDPATRDTYKADKWRHAQDVCGRVAGLAEAAALAWRVTGEERYLEKAREFLLKASTWHFDPDWRSGDVPGATDIEYNDEANFRLWRKLPLVYDQIRDELTEAERRQILDHFRIRGTRTVEWIRASNIAGLKRNSLEVEPRSHPVRFMAMVGLTALALWDDLPELAHDWWAFAYTFYRDQFSPFGGDDGGWAEGNAYWRGTFEHAIFQDALLAIGDPLAYASPFWKNTPYFAVYNVQPYLHTIFGDASNAGHFNLEPVVAEYLRHLGRVQQDGYLITYASLVDDPRTPPSKMGLGKLDRTYPTAAEFLIRNFIGSAFPLPEPRPLSELPPYRYFSDIGWVSMHSALGDPANDIHITFKSSPYGSYSHSHADQNAFILNAYGEGLAINSANREFHRSPHHQHWTWQTRSKNAVLIDGLGQKSQDKHATGKITRFEVGDRYALATGDARVAYNTLQPFDKVKRATRDLVFIDQRYLVIRDVVHIADGATLAWRLQAEQSQGWDNLRQTGFILGEKATLTTKFISPDHEWAATITDRYPVPIDPRYFNGETYTWVTARWRNHVTLNLESMAPARRYVIYAVLWPEKNGLPARHLDATLEDGVLIVHRPDGKVDQIHLSDTDCRIE